MKLYDLRKMPEINTVEITIPDWKLRGVKNKLRVFRLNDNEFQVVAPGKGGNFRLSYSYEFNMPLNGSGEKSIINKIKTLPYGMNDFRQHERMIEITAQAINRARLYLMSL